MVNTSNYLLYQLDTLNKQQLKVSYQMSSGKAISSGSEDSLLFNNIINLENDINLYSNIETQIDQSMYFNSSSDTAVGEIKKQMEAINSEVLKALNDGIDEGSQTAIANNIESMEDTIFSMANETANGEYVFSGTNSQTKPFVKNADGSIDYVNENDHKKVVVEKNTYRQQGLNGFDLMYYTTDTATNGNNLEFNDGDVVLDSEGNEWKFVDHNGDGNIDNDRLYKNGDPSTTPMAVTSSGSPTVYTVSNTQTTSLETKANYFDVLNTIENALNGLDSDGNSINEEQSKDILSASLEEIDKAYDSINAQHAKLGSINKSFEDSSVSISAKVTNLQIFNEETASADLTEAAVKAQALEMTYTALYSAISRVNSLSLVNHL